MTAWQTTLGTWVLLIAAVAGCGRPPAPETTDINLGTPRTRSPRDPQRSQKPAEDPPARAAEPEGSHTGRASGSPDQARDEATGEPSGREASNRPNAAGPREPEGTTDSGSGGGGTSRGGLPQPAFPGRPSRHTGSTPKEAEAEARRLVIRARAAAKRGDTDEACRDALQAYETASEHADVHEGCDDVARDADRLLASIGRHNPVQDVPTRFE